jgi:hypothetical protein
MDVYFPLDAMPGERRPVLMFVHGGAGSESRPKNWAYKGPRAADPLVVREGAELLAFVDQ